MVSALGRPRSLRVAGWGSQTTSIPVAAIASRQRRAAMPYPEWSSRHAYRSVAPWHVRRAMARIPELIEEIAALAPTASPT